MEERRALSKTSGSTGKKKEPKYCKVCGDKASGGHFGILACQCCKAFFRRSIRNEKTYRCKYKNGECVINSKETRGDCQYCRLKKCLQCGMCADVMQVRQKGGNPMFACFGPEPPERIESILSGAEWLLSSNERERGKETRNRLRHRQSLNAIRSNKNVSIHNRQLQLGSRDLSTKPSHKPAPAHVTNDLEPAYTATPGHSDQPFNSYSGGISSTFQALAGSHYPAASGVAATPNNDDHRYIPDAYSSANASWESQSGTPNRLQGGQDKTPSITLLHYIGDQADSTPHWNRSTSDNYNQIAMSGDSRQVSPSDLNSVNSLPESSSLTPTFPPCRVCQQDVCMCAQQQQYQMSDPATNFGSTQPQIPDYIGSNNENAQQFARASPSNSDGSPLSYVSL